MKHILLIIISVTTLFANAQVGTQKQIGADGAWGNATAATTLNNKLYTTEKSGVLVETDLNTGMRKTVGKAGFENNRFLFASGAHLYMIDFAGTLYKITLPAATKEMLGLVRSYAGIYAYGVVNGVLYGVDKKGDMITADLSTGDKEETSGGSYTNTSLLFAANERIYCVEQSGSLFEWAINGGSKHMLGKQGEFAATTSGLGFNGGLYLVDKSGILSYIDTGSGARTKIGKPIFGLTKYIFGVGGKLYTIETMGSLYEVVLK